MARLIKFFNLSSIDRRLVIETFVLLGLARAAVLVLPFRRLASALGEPKSASAQESKADALRTPQIRQVARAIERVGSHTPWRSNCLAKAVAARVMLRRRRIASTIYFGMAKDAAGEFEAHAWLSSCGIILTGGAEADRFAVVATFAD